MIKPKEIRIGNYIEGYWESEIDRGNGIIEDVESSEIVQVLGYDPFDDLIYTEGGYRCEYDKFTGVPITEEWLLRFGFVRTDNAEEYRQGQIIYNAGFLSKGEPECGTYVEYVHQFQNLYFALVGEDLKELIKY